MIGGTQIAGVSQGRVVKENEYTAETLEEMR